MEVSTNLKKAIENYINGNADAFTTIYNESHRYIYVCVNNVMSGNDNKDDLIQDIMQDTYVEISKHINSLQNVNQFLSWSGTIATRKCYEYIKKIGKYTLLNENESFDSLADDDNFIPEEIMQNKEKQRLLREIIQNELSEMQKLCVVGYFYNGMKQSEIARELDIPENSVKSHLLRAKGKIKEAVLDLEKKKDTKLYAVTPFLLLLFTDEVKACIVSPAIGKAVFSRVGTSSAFTTGSAIAKTGVATMKVKTIIIAASAAVTLGGVGAGVGIAVHNKKQNVDDESTKTVEMTTDEISTEEDTKEEIITEDTIEDTVEDTTEDVDTSEIPNQVEEELGKIAGNWAALDGGSVFEFVPARGNEAALYFAHKDLYVRGKYETDDTTYIKVNYTDAYDDSITGVIEFEVVEMGIDYFGEISLTLIDKTDNTRYYLIPSNIF